MPPGPPAGRGDEVLKDIENAARVPMQIGKFGAKMALRLVGILSRLPAGLANGLGAKIDKALQRPGRVPGRPAGRPPAARPGRGSAPRPGRAKSKSMGRSGRGSGMGFRKGRSTR